MTNECLEVRLRDCIVARLSYVFALQFCVFFPFPDMVKMRSNGYYFNMIVGIVVLEIIVSYPSLCLRKGIHHRSPNRGTISIRYKPSELLKYPSKQRNKCLSTTPFILVVLFILGRMVEW